MLKKFGTMKILVLLLFNLSLCLGVEYQPRHVHLALGKHLFQILCEVSTLCQLQGIFTLTYHPDSSFVFNFKSLRLFI